MERAAYVTEDGSGETSDDTAGERDTEVGGRAEGLAFLFRHRAVHEFMAQLVHGELANGIRDLSGTQHELATTVSTERPTSDELRADGRTCIR